MVNYIASFCCIKVEFIKIDKIAGFLLIPYIAWLIFAGVLNYFIWFLNEM